MTTHNTHSTQSNLSNDDIIAAARHLRQKENEQMRLRPWKRHSRREWHVAIPAACLVGFALGFYLRPSADVPKENLVKTVVRTDTVLVQEVVRDTVYQIQPVSQPIAPQHLAQKQSSKPKAEEVKEERVGISMLEDGIRYDLLASNN